MEPPVGHRTISFKGPLPLALAALWILLVAGCPSGPRAKTYADAAPLPDGTLPVGYPPCDSARSTQLVTFIQTGDLHATYTPDAPGESPLSRIRGFYEWMRWEQPYTLFVDSGDAYEKGSVAEQLSAGQSTREIIQNLAFDVRVLGNHDFAWSLAETLAFSQDPRALVLASNTTYLGVDATAFGAVAYGERELGCLRVGFFGLVNRPWNEQNQQYDGPYYPEFDSRYDFAARAQELVTQNRNAVDLLVMVSHLGLATDRQVVQQVDGIDVVLGGHSHDALLEPTYSGGSILVHSGSYARFVGHLELEVSTTDGAIVDHHYKLVRNLPGTLPVPVDAQAALEATLAAWAPDALVPLTWLAAPQGTRAVARLAARAAISLMAVDAALVDTDEVWMDWDTGPLTQQDLIDTFPVERQPPGTPGFNSFYRVTLTGAELGDLAAALSSRWALEHPSALDPGATYDVAVQKHVAFSPDRYLPDGLVFGDPVPLQEVWLVLDEFGRQRTSSCVHLDDDTPLDGC